MNLVLFLLKCQDPELLPFIIYGGNDDETATARHLKVTIKGITPVSVPISWLDSAKQFPLNDEYLPPLLQSDGGYDLTANGTPQIIIK